MSSAKGNNEEDQVLSEGQLLAPWFVTGKLDEAEAHALEKLAREDTEFARFIEEAKRERVAVAAASDALGTPSPAVWERIERSIGQEAPAGIRSQRATALRRLTASIAEFFEGFSVQQWQAAAAAAALLFLMQAATIAYLALHGNEPAKFGVASGQKNGGALKPSFIVAFTPQTTVAEAGAILDKAGATIVGGPSGDGLYRLGLRDDSVASKDFALKVLRASPAIKLVLPEK
jgi:anti-sigma-K factor RskA